MLALAEWEDGRCPGCGNQLDDTTDPDAEFAYVHGDEARCHACTTQARYAMQFEEAEHRHAILFTPPRRRERTPTTPGG